jgi:heme exporter protein CcmD
MIEIVLNFLNMGGYGFYVWSAYGSVLTFLLIQWLIPWVRWQKYLHKREK